MLILNLFTFALFNIKTKIHIMKKLLTLLGCIVLIVASSCTKQYISPSTTTNQTLYADLTPSDWSLFSDGKSYTGSISISQLTSDFSSIGGVIVAISFDNGVSYEQLPEVYGGIAYSYTYTSGNITIYSQSALGTTAVAPGSTIKVKIILVDSNG